jgi:hypothetical protein
VHGTNADGIFGDQTCVQERDYSVAAALLQMQLVKVMVEINDGGQNFRSQDCCESAAAASQRGSADLVDGAANADGYHVAFRA